jgi:predicted double-glycine peptidase
MRIPSQPRRRWASRLAGGALIFAALAQTAAAEPSSAVRLNGQADGSYTVSVMSWRDIPFRTVVRQRYDYSCGSAALATLLHYSYGLPVGEAEIFQSMYSVGDQARIREVGFSMLDMKRYLEGRGFRADGLRLDLDRIETIGAPMVALITHRGYRHFVVVKGVRDDRVLVGDPTFGLQTYSRANFEGMWNGVVLAVRATPVGVTGAVFNEQSEWRPWSVAPLDLARETATPSDMLRELPMIYQITPTAIW